MSSLLLKNIFENEYPKARRRTRPYPRGHSRCRRGPRGPRGRHPGDAFATLGLSLGTSACRATPSCRPCLAGPPGSCVLSSCSRPVRGRRGREGGRQDPLGLGRPGTTRRGRSAQVCLGVSRGARGHRAGSGMVFCGENPGSERLGRSRESGPRAQPGRSRAPSRPAWPPRPPGRSEAAGVVGRPRSHVARGAAPPALRLKRARETAQDEDAVRTDRLGSRRFSGGGRGRTPWGPQRCSL